MTAPIEGGIWISLVFEGGRLLSLLGRSGGSIGMLLKKNKFCKSL